VAGPGLLGARRGTTELLSLIGWARRYSYLRPEKPSLRATDRLRDRKDREFSWNKQYLLADGSICTEETVCY